MTKTNFVATPFGGFDVTVLDAASAADAFIRLKVDEGVIELNFPRRDGGGWNKVTTKIVAQLGDAYVTREAGGREEVFIVTTNVIQEYA